MNPIVVASVVAALVMAGAVAGAFLGTLLPRHHLDGDTKEMVKLGVAFFSTLAALVLGLIVSSAKASFDAKSAEIQGATVKILLLNNDLKEVGSAADPARELLREILAERLATMWGANQAPSSMPATAQARHGGKDLQKVVRALAPTGDAQRSAWSQATQLTDELAQLRLIAIAHSGSTITMPLLVVLVLWLMIIAVGANLFAPRNGTIVAVNVLWAVSVAGAIFLILEMDQPFGGLIQVSDAPLRAALAELKN